MMEVKRRVRHRREDVGRVPASSSVAGCVEAEEAIAEPALQLVLESAGVDGGIAESDIEKVWKCVDGRRGVRREITAQAARVVR